MLLQAARQRRRSLAMSNGDQSNGTGSTSAAIADQQAGASKPATKKNWLKHRLFNMSKGSLKNLEEDESDATSRASSAADLQVSLPCKGAGCESLVALYQGASHSHFFHDRNSTPTAIPIPKVLWTTL